MILVCRCQYIPSVSLDKGIGRGLSKCGQQLESGNFQPAVISLSFVSLWTRGYFTKRLCHGKGNNAEFVVGLRKELGGFSKEPSDDSPHFITDIMTFIHQHRDHHCTTFHESQGQYFAVMLARRPTNCYCISVVVTCITLIPPNHSYSKNVQSTRSQLVWVKLITSRIGCKLHNEKVLLHRKQLQQGIPPEFHCSVLDKKKAHLLPQGFRLILSGMLKASGKSELLSSTAVIDIPELSWASHKEADTRIFCYLQYSVVNIINIRELLSKHKNSCLATK